MIERVKDLIKHNKKIFIIISSVLILNIVIFGVVLLTIPRIKLNGNDVEIDVGNRYVEPGYKAYNFMDNITNKLKVSNNINNKKIGTYYVDYKVKYLFFYFRSRRIVKVVDRLKPEIVLKGEEEIAICPNKEYVEIGYSATDNYDGDLTQHVIVTKEDDKVIYKVTDTSGNITTKVRKIAKKDSTKPEIKLKGSGNMIIYVGNSYNEPGYSASDNCDGDLTDKVSVSGSVNNTVAGSNTITYKVKDASGNETVVSRSVTVKEKVNYPTISGSSGGGNGVIYLTFDDGPSSSITPQVLNVLKEEGVKATFFIVNRGSGLDYLIVREHNEGHVVALHSNTHNYAVDYGSKDAYINGLNILSNKVKSLIGVDSKIIRFPGGSSNTISKRYTVGVMSYLATELPKRGYKYFDWNVDSCDAGGAKSSDDVYRNVVNGLSHSKTNVVLMHDYEGNYKTLNALRNIIKYGKSNGYSFAGITMSTPQVRHSVVN